MLKEAGRVESGCEQRKITTSDKYIHVVHI